MRSNLTLLLKRRIAVLAVACLPLVAGTSGTEAPLADAVQEKSAAKVQTLLQQRADVNAAQADGMTALHWAAYQDDLATAEALLKNGADVRAGNRYGVTPLSLACTNGSAAMVKLLLKAGADANTMVSGGETVLMTAARTGDLDTVKELLAAGADVNAKETGRGQTALMWASAEGHTEILKALLAAGADLHARLDSGFSAFLFAVREGQIAAARALIEAGADPNEVIESGKPPRGGRPRNGTSALLIAVDNAHFEMAAVLLDAGANPNADAPGYTVLHAIAPVRNPGVGDNDPPPPGSGNMTSLELVGKLAAKGADLNARMTRNVNLGNTALNKMGATPFFVAAQSADAELMRALTALGADPKITNADNSTALMAITGLGTRSPGEDAGTEEEVLEAAQVALDLGIDINAVDNHGETAMHGAAYKNLPKVVEFLAEKGARIEIWNAKNEFGWTPLTIAEGYRFGNFKPSPVTIAAILQVMAAAGVSPPAIREPVKSKEIY